MSSDGNSSWTFVPARRVAAFRKRTPKVGLELVPLSSIEQWTALRQGTIAFGYGAYAPNDDTLGHLEMSREHGCLSLATGSGSDRHAAASRLLGRVDAAWRTRT